MSWWERQTTHTNWNIISIPLEPLSSPPHLCITQHQSVSMLSDRKDIWSLVVGSHSLLVGIYCSCPFRSIRLLLLWFQIWVTAIFSKAVCSAACLVLPSLQGSCKIPSVLMLSESTNLSTLLLSPARRDIFLDWVKEYHSHCFLPRYFIHSSMWQRTMWLSWGNAQRISAWMRRQEKEKVETSFMTSFSHVHILYICAFLKFYLHYAFKVCPWWLCPQIIFQF